MQGTYPAGVLRSVAPAEAVMVVGSSRRHILIVDDDPDCLDALRYLLEDRGYDVVAARHGLEALEHVDQGGRPALVVLDLLMPVMDGLEFLRRRRDHPVLRATPVIVLTATDARIGSTEDVVLRKPVDFGVLLEAIQRACGLEAGPQDAVRSS